MTPRCERCGHPCMWCALHEMAADLAVYADADAAARPARLDTLAPDDDEGDAPPRTRLKQRRGGRRRP